jgi:cytochrome P450
MSTYRPVSYLPGEALLALHRLRGPVIELGVGRYGYTFLAGAEANKFVFANAEAFSWRETFEKLTLVDGPTALVVSDGDDHRRRRSVVAQGLGHRPIRDYVRIMAASVDAVIDGWKPGQQLDIYQQCRTAVRHSHVESLFGRGFAVHSDFIQAQLEPILQLTKRLPMMTAVQMGLHPPGWRRAMAARTRLYEFVSAQIADARAVPRPDDRMLATLINGRGEEGYALSDNEICDSVVQLINAGNDTTASALTWAVYSLMTLPGAWDTAADEVERVLGDRPPTTADLDSLTFLYGVVQETLRLYPPVVVSARRVMRDLSFAGRRIRAGRMLIFSAYVTHRMPEVWSEPTEFRPARWDPSAPGYRKPAPHEFITFSGGLHRCVGVNFATTEILVMLARILAKSRLRMIPQRVRAAGLGGMAPHGGLAVEVTDLMRAQ